MSQPISAPGARLRHIRLRKGLTQEQLAAQAGISAVMVSLTERGERFPRMPVLLRLARALDVSLGELTGQEAPPDREQAGVAGLREALLSPAALAGAGADENGPPLPVPVLRGKLAAARRAYWDGRFGLLGDILPGLLRNARATALGNEEALEPLALARDLAACLLVHYGQDDLAAVASERSVLAAWYAGDGLLAAALRGTFAWVLLHQGRLDEAEDLARRTAEAIRPGPGAGRGQVATCGVLLLTALGPAAAAGRDASAYLEEARELTVRAGGAVASYNTTFGTAQVAMQAVHAAAVAGNPAAALAAARGVRPGELEPVSYGRHLLDVAQAHADDGRDSEAIAVLAQARDIAPQWWRQQEVAGLLVRQLGARSRRMPDLLRELAAAAQAPGRAAYFRPANGA